MELVSDSDPAAVFSLKMDTGRKFDCEPSETKPGAFYIAKVTVGAIALLACIVTVITLARLRRRGGFYLCVLVISVVDLEACLTGFLLTTIPTHVCHPYDNVALVDRTAWIVFLGSLPTSDWILVLTGIERIVDMVAPGQWFKIRNCGVVIAIGLIILLSTGGHILYYFLDNSLNDIAELVSIYRIVAVYLPMSIVTMIGFVLGIILLRKKRTATTYNRISFMQRHGSCITYIALAINLIIVQLVIIVIIEELINADGPLTINSLIHAERALRLLQYTFNIWFITIITGIIFKFVLYVSFCVPFRRVMFACSKTDITVLDRPNSDSNSLCEGHLEFQQTED